MKNPHKDVSPKQESERKRGAPQGNTNALQAGLRAKKSFVRGKTGLQYADRRLIHLERWCMDSVTARDGECSLTLAATIDSACRWYAHALRVQHWLRHEINDLNPEQRLKYSEAIARACDNRDKHIRLLELDAKPKLPTLEGYLEKLTVQDAEAKP